MYIQQLYTGCLSEAAYYLESGKEAAIIDPLRDIEPYLEMAASRGAKIKYIFETHFHADFVSGHLDLAKATGAPIVYGPQADTEFSIYAAKDGELFPLGEISLEVLHTPGHTLESSCYLVRDAESKPVAIFTGDTLFVGDVGRPDLSSGNLSKEKLASLLYDSLQNKILPLSEDIVVYPAHGPGSSCGKNLGPETFSTIGQEKQTNYALQAQSREQFIKVVTEGLSAPPQYFPVNARINKEGYDSLDAILEQALRPLDVAQVKALSLQKDLLILDSREPEIFAEGFVPGAVNIGLSGRFAEWAGSLLPFDVPILLICPLGQERETAIRLARVGFDQMVGYLNGGITAWTKAGESVDMVISIDADELAMDLPFDPKMVVVDVRREIEFADGHLKGALNLPLESLKDPAHIASLDENQNLYVHCAGGYRSMVACSLIKRQGLHNLRNISGGFNAIKTQPSIPIVKENSVLN